MIINEDLIEEIKKINAPQNVVLLYLLSINFNLKTDLFPERIKRLVHASGIISNTEDNKGINWKYPLFEGQETDKSFKWVEEEYVVLFKKANPKKHTNTRECVRRMRKFFGEHPDVRKDEVIKAVKFHIRDVGDPRYIKRSDYFISKGKGLQKESYLLNYIERIRELKENSGEMKSKIFTIKN